jgi:exopolyphosphatase/guanosine-5'-triphosphate,3'-diphosphate pyrophosphatase
VIALRVDIGPVTSSFRSGERVVDVPIGTAVLVAQLVNDPPAPEELTNALGLVSDHIDDVVRAIPEVVDATAVEVRGAAMRAVVAVELGHDAVPAQFALGRDAADDVFRTVATEPRADRAANPGLAADDVDDVVAACCFVLALMRRLHLDEVTVVE